MTGVDPDKPPPWDQPTPPRPKPEPNGHRPDEPQPDWSPPADLAPTDMWAGWDELTEPPEEHDTSVTAKERAEVDLGEFWRARPALTLIHEWAKARRVGPWAVLGAVLARVIANTPPALVLPPTTGGVASLNLFVGLVGASGVGKDSAQNTARVVLDVRGNLSRPLEAPVGSGEGLSHMFMRPPARPVRGEEREDGPQQYNTKALVRAGEIDTLAAQQSRNASTLSAQLRHAAMGEELGAFYVDVAKRMIVPRHCYRLCLIAGIQPSRAGILLDDADGGTPQRWLWLPAGDEAARVQVPDAPPPLVWTPPDLMPAPRLHELGDVWFQMTLPGVAVEAQVAVRVAGLREEADSLDAHAVLTRTKVAAGLALLDERIITDDDDWRLSGVIMTVSDSQRARCQKVLSETAAVNNRQKAVAEAERTVVITEHVDQDRRRRLGAKLKRRLARVGPDGEAPGALRKALDARDRDMFEPVVDALLNAGEIRAVEGSRSVRYTLVV